MLERMMKMCVFFQKFFSTSTITIEVVIAGKKKCDHHRNSFQINKIILRITLKMFVKGQCIF